MTSLIRGLLPNISDMDRMDLTHDQQMFSNKHFKRHLKDSKSDAQYANDFPDMEHFVSTSSSDDTHFEGSSREAPSSSSCSVSSKSCVKGFEYKSKAHLFGIPLLHISFKYKNRKPVPARGIIAIGQFAAGFISIAQFGIGIISISQMAISYFAIAQIAIAHNGLAQIALFLKDFIM